MSSDILEYIGFLTIDTFKRSVNRVKGAFRFVNNRAMDVLNKSSLKSWSGNTMKSLNQKKESVKSMTKRGVGSLMSVPKQGWGRMQKMLSQARSSKKLGLEETLTGKNLQQNLVKPGTERAIGYWLLTIAALIFVLLCLGASTRLIKFGHTLVPSGYRAEFETLKRYIQYYLHRKKTQPFALTFLEEYLPTLLEKFIGFLFMVPFSYYLFRGYLMPKLRNRCFGLIAMHFLQGIIGTWMVNKEYTHKPSLRQMNIVSTYRMFLHWNTTMVMFAVILWNGLTLLRRPTPVSQGNRKDMMCARTKMLIVLFINALNFATGVMVAGIDGSRHFNTFPDMNGRLIPKGYLGTRPIWKDLFLNVATVQFHHRVFAFLTYTTALYMFIMSRRSNLISETRRGILALFIVANIQLINGILVLFTRGFWIVGLFHQVHALLLFCASLFIFHTLKNLPNQQPGPSKPLEKEQPMMTKKEKVD
jgi:cytochrome c oxidase assembly protein subunit 15